VTTTFPHFVLRGSHREVGRQHGEALRSLCRQERIAALLEAARGRLDASALKTILRDHVNRPHSICAHPGERVSYSFASLIADLDGGALEIAVGPPCEHEYVTYKMGEGGR